MTSDGENNPPAGTANAQLGALLLDCAAAFETHGSTAGDELAEALRNAGVRGDCPPASTAAACEVLPQVLEPRIGDHAIVDRLRVINHLLAWRSSAAIRALGALEGQLAVVVLLGPQGMFHSERCMAGLFLQKPRLYYPEHWHEADELYLVLSGRAEWGLEGQVPGRRVPGEFVHHRSWQRHCMRTASEPLLALWGWTGNISIDTYRMAPMPESPYNDRGR